MYFGPRANPFWIQFHNIPVKFVRHRSSSDFVFTFHAITLGFWRRCIISDILVPFSGSFLRAFVARFLVVLFLHTSQNSAVPSPHASAVPNFWSHFYASIRSATFAHGPRLLRSFQIRFGFVALSGFFVSPDSSGFKRISMDCGLSFAF